MVLLKVRRVGNSNVVTLPRALAERGFDAGTYVVLDERDGELILRPVSLTEAVREAAREVVAEDREALDSLAAYDRGEAGALQRGT